MSDADAKLFAHAKERLAVYKTAIREAVMANLPRKGKDESGNDVIEIEMAAAVALAHISAFIVSSLEQNPQMGGQAVNIFLSEFERALARGSTLEPVTDEKVHSVS